MNPIPLHISCGSPLTTRELLTAMASCGSTDKVLNILDEMHGNSDCRETYRGVIATLLAKPPSPPRYPVLFQFVEEEEGQYIDLSFLNTAYEEPPKDLKPYYCGEGEAPPAGHYDLTRDVYQQTFSMSFCKWDEVIDASLWIDSERVRELVPTLEKAAAFLLWELTFFSFSEEETQKKWAEILGAKNEFLAEKGLDSGPQI